MIPTSSWATWINVTSSYEYKEAILPTPYVAKIYDRLDSNVGVNIPQLVNVVKKIGTPSNELLATNGVYASIQLNNAYDVILLDTILNTTT
jgi:hypothetical protein